jgi:DNA-binding SARP family transcriptional activator
MRLDLLRSFELCHGNQRMTLPMSAQRLIAFLALQRGVLKRIYVAGTLWMDYNQEAANANLRTTLWRLRQLSRPLVHTSATHLSLSGDVTVDVHEKAAIAQRVSSNGSDCTDRYADEIMLAGDLLPDWYDDWVVIERERFRQVRLHALESLCYALARKGRYDKAIELGLAAVADEPLRESAHRAVMRAHLAEGNRCEALRQYELCRCFLRDRLGFEPSPETQRLRERCGYRDAAVTLAV